NGLVKHNGHKVPWLYATVDECMRKAIREFVEDSVSDGFLVIEVNCDSIWSLLCNSLECAVKKLWLWNAECRPIGELVVHQIIFGSTHDVGRRKDRIR